MKKFILQKIEVPVNQSRRLDAREHIDKENKELVQRLYDLGLHPGIEIEVISKISFNSVTIIQFGVSRLALNYEEFACLHGL